MRIDSISKFKKNISSQHILTLNGAVASLLKDFEYRGVIYKEDEDSLLYYFSNGLLYPALKDNSTGNLYYINEANVEIWCR